MKTRKVAIDVGTLVRVHSVPSPCGKAAYSSRKVAKMRAAISSRMSGEWIEAYKCRRGCHAWHLGHPPGSRPT